MNGDANECRDSVDQATGRFIHMEQDPILRKPYAQSWSHIENDKFAKRLSRHSRAPFLPIPELCERA